MPRERFSLFLVFVFSFFVVVVRVRDGDGELRYDDVRDAALFCELEEQKEYRDREADQRESSAVVVEVV